MYLKFNDATALIKCTVTQSGNVVTIKFPKAVVVDTSGFRLYLDEKGEYDIGGENYLGFTTIYRNDEETAKYNGYQLSNDGSKYKPVLPVVYFSSGAGGDLSGKLNQTVSDFEDLVIPVPKPYEKYRFVEWRPEIPVSGEVLSDKYFTAVFEYVPSIEEVKNAKEEEIKEERNKIIFKGVEMYGRVFPYDYRNQVIIRKAYEDSITTYGGFFAEDEAGEIVDMTNEQCVELYMKQEKNRIENEAHTEQLLKMIKNAVKKADVQKISYNSELNGEYLDGFVNRIQKETTTLKKSAMLTSAVNAQAKIMAVNNTDEQALKTKWLYIEWEEKPDGYMFSMDNPEDRRCNDRGKLWSLQKDHKKQENWRPGNEPTLWREIVETHKGTCDDPIPVPDSVHVSGFDYVVGNFYLDGVDIYKMVREGSEQGDIITLFFMPSELVGSYFEKQ